MLVKEKLLTGSFFDELNKHGSLPFITVDNIPALNNLLLLSCGDRNLFSKLNDYDLELIVGFIHTLHSPNWISLYELHNSTLLGGDVRTVTETVDNTENRTNTRTELNKVSGYNSDELITNDGLDVNGGDDVTGNKTRTLEDKRTNVKTAFNDLLLTQNHSIINTVLKDITLFLSTSIY